MRKPLIYVFFIYLSIVSNQNHSLAAYMTGNDLYKYCKAETSGLKSLCAGFVSGVSDAFTMMSDGKGICVPKRVTVNQLIDIVVNYLEDNPGKRHHEASTAIFVALATEFPC